MMGVVIPTGRKLPDIAYKTTRKSRRLLFVIIMYCNSIIISILSFILPISSIGAWSYSDLNHWPSKCFEKAQSPLNIQRQLTIYDKSLSDKPLVLSGFDIDTVNPIKVKNNGHTAVFELGDGEIKTITGGSLGNNVYNLLQFHFHWGGDDKVGSEHTVDGERFPLEMHMVFIRNDIGNFTSALSIDNSLTVLGIMFEIGEYENKDFVNIINKINVVKYTGVNHNLAVIKLGSLLPNHDHRASTIPNFYTYFGSLTTPPCSEVVVWNLIPRSVKITKSQMQKFRELTKYSESDQVNDADRGVIGQNYRPLQDLNGRVVKRSFEPYGFGAAKDSHANDPHNDDNSASGVSATFFVVFFTAFVSFVSF